MSTTQESPHPPLKVFNLALFLKDDGVAAGEVKEHALPC